MLARHQVWEDDFTRITEALQGAIWKHSLRRLCRMAAKSGDAVDTWYAAQVLLSDPLKSWAKSSDSLPGCFKWLVEIHLELTQILARPFMRRLTLSLSSGWCEVNMAMMLQKTAEDARRKEAQLLKQYDYAWNSRQAGCQARHVNIVISRHCFSKSVMLVSKPVTPAIQGGSPLSSGLKNLPEAIAEHSPSNMATIKASPVQIRVLTNQDGISPGPQSIQSRSTRSWSDVPSFRFEGTWGKSMNIVLSLLSAPVFRLWSASDPSPLLELAVISFDQIHEDLIRLISGPKQSRCPERSYWVYTVIRNWATDPKAFDNADLQSAAVSRTDVHVVAFV